MIQVKLIVWQPMIDDIKPLFEAINSCIEV